MEGNRKIRWLEACQHPHNQLRQIHVVEVITSSFKACITKPIFWSDMDCRLCISFNGIHGITTRVELEVTYFRFWEDFPNARVFSHRSSRTCVRSEEHTSELQ